MQTRHYDLAALNHVLCASPGELDLSLPPGAVRGAIPAALHGGTYFLNGPGRVRIGGRLVHPFDGHGYVRALRFSDAPGGGVRLQARFVRTPAFVAEEEAGAVRYRGLGTQVPGGWGANRRAPDFRNVANTCVLPWAGQLLALWEGGPPYALDPRTLETRGLATFGGLLQERTAFLAHTRLCPRSGRLIGLCPELRFGRTRFTFHEIDEGGAVVASTRAELPAPTFTHDFAVTPGFFVVLENRISVDPLRLLRWKLGGDTILSMLRASDRPSRALLVPRDGGAARLIDLQAPTYTFHHANAWEEDGRVVLVSCVFDHIRFGAEFGYKGPDAPLDPGVRTAAQAQRLTRITIDPGRGTGREIVTREVLGPYAVDFPRVHPARDGQRTAYLVGATTSAPGLPDPFDSVARVDLESGATALYTPAPGQVFIGEPLLVPQEDGAELVLVMAYDGSQGGRSTLLILESDRLAQGPVAQVELPALLPYGFHGYFSPGAPAT